MSEEMTAAQASLDLTKAMLAADKRHLALLLSDELSYGHQGGVIQGKTAFIDMIVAKKPYKSITISEASSSIAGLRCNECDGTAFGTFGRSGNSETAKSASTGADGLLRAALFNTLKR